MMSPFRHPHIAAILFGLLATQVSALTVQVLPDRMHVKPGQAVCLRIAASEKAAIDCVVVNRVHHETARFRGETDDAGQCQFTFSPTEEFGYEVNVVATAGEAKAHASDVFACSRNPWQTATSYCGDSLRFFDESPADSPPNATLKAYADNWVQIARESYAPVTEVLSVTPCPFSSMVPPTENYISGQGATVYKDSVKGLRYLIAQLHDNGLYAVVYANGAVSGVAGTEYARKHPEQLCFNPDGSIAGGLNTQTLRLMQQFYRDYPQSLHDEELMRALVCADPAGLHLAPINFTNLKTAEHGAKELIKAREFFGFDGVRFDGHYSLRNYGDPLAPVASVLDITGHPLITPEADQFSARNMQRVIQMIREKHPDYLFGFNTGDFVSDQAVESQETRIIAPGNYVLDETAKHVDQATEARNRWVDYAREMAVEADRARKLDAMLFAGWTVNRNEEFFKFIKAFTWAAGARYVVHPAFQTVEEYRKQTPWVRQYNQFAYRYSRYLINDKLKRIPAATVDRTVRVTAERPVFFRDFVQKLDDADESCLVVNLVNSPVEDRACASPTTPPPATQVKVELADVKLRGQTVFVLNPEAEKQRQEVAIKVEGSKTSVVAPTFDHWCILIISVEKGGN
ncbi:MAG: hypothetical protein IT440_09615 [Phycisphaeraceae bacterium]|nr:hypothetical protein [Phycisphaeraceae bacterium]